jgi:hypothetical protein
MGRNISEEPGSALWVEKRFLGLREGFFYAV